MLFSILKLLLSNYVKSNPAPYQSYKVMKTVTGSFNQGSKKFGDTAGL